VLHGVDDAVTVSHGVDDDGEEDDYTYPVNSLFDASMVEADGDGRGGGDGDEIFIPREVLLAVRTFLSLSLFIPLFFALSFYSFSLFVLPCLASWRDALPPFFLQAKSRPRAGKVHTTTRPARTRTPSPPSAGVPDVRGDDLLARLRAEAEATGGTILTKRANTIITLY
jgi:hypothetical protein